MIGIGVSPLLETSSVESIPEGVIKTTDGKEIIFTVDGEYILTVED